MAEPRRRRSGIALIVLMVLGVPLSARGETEEWFLRDGEVSRRVLAILDFRELEYGDISDSAMHTILQKPLNHLGFMVDYADPDLPLPDFRPYRAIVIWLYSYQMNEAENFLPWVLDAVDAGVKLILPTGLDAPIGPDGKAHGEKLLEEIHARLGIENAPKDRKLQFDRVRVNYLEPEKFFYETRRFREDAVFALFRAREGADVWQRIESIDDPDVHVVSVVMSDAGFWSLSDNMIYHSFDVMGGGFRMSWNLNPWIMLREVLDCREMPAPDVTTYSGMRGAYSHVDVDGPYNMTEPDVPGPSRFAIDVLLNEVWKKYDFPVTVAPISAEYDPDLDLRFADPDTPVEEAWDKPRPAYLPPHREVANRLREYAAEIFGLPYIQAGCHAYTHPLDWYNLYCGYAIPGYHPTYEMEIRGAVEYLNRHVLPPDKPVEVYQWSGDCKPPVEALAILKEMGLDNINGGDPMYDPHYNSIYYICSLYIQKGEYRQVYASACNENIYTDHWTGFKGAFNNVIFTFEKSESPIRLLPVNIYYHVFPAVAFAGWKAIQNVYEWAKKQELCWITTREYTRAVNDFMDARIGRTADGGWWIEDYKSCRTVRFDLEEGLVDMDASVNVAGFVRHNGSLYVSLLPGERAEIRLTGEMPAEPCLARATGLVRNVEKGDDYWQAECRSWSGGFVELWAPAGNWRGSVTFPGGEPIRSASKRLADGRIRIDVPGGSGEWMGIRLEN
ncbi:MAG: hypothetical protein LBE84_00810 [Planctomycetota bacterium]|nr:hypothetical protein [Planctomycetota bacterium]